MPYCDISFSDGNYILMQNTVEVKMLYVLMKKFNFLSQVIYANQSWGAIENGVWVGSVGHLHNKVK